MQEPKTSTIEEYEKSQIIRLVDVFFIAPVLMYTAYKAKDLPKSLRMIVLIIGLGTLLYNGKNYLKNRQNASR